MIKRYDSIAALRADYVAKNGGQRSRGGFGDNSWYNNETEADSLWLAETGDTSLVAKAEQQLNQLDTAIETPRKVWERNVAGAYCVVPDYLSGLPTPMRRQVPQQDDRAPITILVVTTCSAGVSAETMQKRGTTILALVMALTRIRPVSLQVLCTVDGYRDRSGETVITAEINTSPLDLATACYALTSVGFVRRLTYGLAEKLNDFHGGWPQNVGYSYGKPKPYYDALVKRLSPDPSKTLIIGSAEFHDRLLSDPLAWIEDQINHFTNQNEEAF